MGEGAYLQGSELNGADQLGSRPFEVASVRRPRPYPGPVELTFTGELWFWKGPSPWHFLTVPDDLCGAIEAASALVTYGWGMIPVTATIGDTEWTTSLWPKDGLYVVPVKAWVRKAEDLELGDKVTVALTLDV